MTASTTFKYLDPDIFPPEAYESAEDFSPEEAMYLWEQAADESFLELPADGTTCEECSKAWNECTCPEGATYDSDVFFDHEEIEVIAGLFLAAWEYSQHLPKDAVPEIDRSSDIWHGVTIMAKDLEVFPEVFREDIAKVKVFVDEWAPEVEESAE